MPFATVTGVRSSWEMFARKSAFAVVSGLEPLGDVGERVASSSRRCVDSATKRSASCPPIRWLSVTLPSSTERIARSTASGPSSFRR